MWWVRAAFYHKSFNITIHEKGNGSAPVLGLRTETQVIDFVGGAFSVCWKCVDCQRRRASPCPSSA